MNGDTAARPPLMSAGQLFRHYADDPLRLLTVVLTTVVLGYGARQDNHSPFTVAFLEDLVGNNFTGVEVLVILIFLMEVIRRLMRRDLWLERSPASRPMILLGIAAGLSPFLRMLIEENRFRVPLELLETPSVILGFFLWLFVYRREDVQLMAWMVLIAGLFKSIEGIGVFLNVGLGWGLLTGWRDAMLMALMVMAIFFAFAIRTDGDRRYRNIRRFAFAILPVVMFTYIGSTRRSFVLGILLAISVLIFYFSPRERRKLLAVALPLVVVVGIAASAVIGSSQFVDRLGVIGDPGSEVSASYRLIELYNISLMIAERPVFGWPMGVPWVNYTLLEVENISPVIPHNTYLYITWRGGFVALAIWIWVLVVMVRMHVRTIKAARTPLERYMAFWLSSATFALIIAGFTMEIGSDRLKWFYPFIMVTTTYLPGAWPARKRGSVRAPAPQRGGSGPAPQADAEISPGTILP